MTVPSAASTRADYDAEVLLQLWQDLSEAALNATKRRQSDWPDLQGVQLRFIFVCSIGQERICLYRDGELRITTPERDVPLDIRRGSLDKDQVELIIATLRTI